MEYSEFLQKFYLPDGGGLVGYKAKKKIPMFFFEYGLDEANEDIICPSDSTFEKWETGARKPDSAIWAEVIRSFDNRKLQKGLMAVINENHLKTLMDSFEITLEEDEQPDKMKFARAVTAQFHAIASGGGSARNVIPTEYKKPPELKGFGTYLWEAKRKYKYMKMPGSEERVMSEFFVCNNIGTSSAAFPHRIRGKYVENATLPTLRRPSTHRGEVRRMILIGACGYGKTLMLQHLFLEAAEHINETGLLPIFVELRNFSDSYSGLLPFLTEAVQEFDPTFTEDRLKDVLEKGQAEILMDGLDEMNPVETKFFQRKLTELCHHYSNNQVVISSRQCSAISGIREFVQMYIHPLNEDQAETLIDKLLARVEDKSAKDIIQSFIGGSRGYVRKNGFMATNPMLLTIMVNNYEQLRDFNGDRIRFYDLMYKALIRGHDEEKESFDRFFHSVGSGREFTTVFREFCSLAYMDGVYQFDQRSFEKYFKMLKTSKGLQNPSIFDVDRFEQDVCATACMMYEQESGIFYIDPGFQDYFFAEYFYFADTDLTKDMGSQLLNRKIDSFRSLDALMMLYKMSRDKVDVCILLPYLDTIFKGKSDKEAFLRFLHYGFGNVQYTLFDEPLIQQYMTSPLKAEKFDMIPAANHTKNIVVELLLTILEQPNNFIIGAMDQTIVQDETAIQYVAGYYERAIDPDDPEEKEHTFLRGMKHDVVYMNDMEYWQDLEITPFPLLSKAGGTACFGFIYDVDPLTFLQNPEKHKDFRDLCESAGLIEVFECVKEYYMEIAEKQKVNKYR